MQFFNRHAYFRQTSLAAALLLAPCHDPAPPQIMPRLTGHGLLNYYSQTPASKANRLPVRDPLIIKIIAAQPALFDGKTRIIDRDLVLEAFSAEKSGTIPDYVNKIPGAPPHLGEISGLALNYANTMTIYPPRQAVKRIIVWQGRSQISQLYLLRLGGMEQKYADIKDAVDSELCAAASLLHECGHAQLSKYTTYDMTRDLHPHETFADTYMALMMLRMAHNYKEVVKTRNFLALYCQLRAVSVTVPFKGRNVSYEEDEAGMQRVQLSYATSLAMRAVLHKAQRLDFIEMLHKTSETDIVMLAKRIMEANCLQQSELDMLDSNWRCGAAQAMPPRLRLLYEIAARGKARLVPVQGFDIANSNMTRAVAKTAHAMQRITSYGTKAWSENFHEDIMNSDYPRGRWADSLDWLYPAP